MTLRNWGRGALLPLLLLAAWQAWAAQLPRNSRAPSPLHVLREAANLIASGALPMATVQSFGRVMSGFALAAGVGISLGLLMGAFGAVRRNLDPIVEAFRPVAAIAILPLAILWFGTGTPAAVFIVAYAAFFPVVVNTMHGVASMDRRLLLAALTMGVPRRRIVRVVVLPAALPSIFVGVRLSMGVAWTAIIAAELAVGAKAGGGASGGLGEMMFVDYAYSVDLNGIVVCMIVVGLVSLLLDRGVRLVERRLIPWGR
jgi:ABC-type nitrate/sulfonate/bicarbonate transport system permease component